MVLSGQEPYSIYTLPLSQPSRTQQIQLCHQGNQFSHFFSLSILSLILNCIFIYLFIQLLIHYSFFWTQSLTMQLILALEFEIFLPQSSRGTTMPKFAYFLYRFFTFSTQFYLKTDAYLVLSDQFTFSLFFFLKSIFWGQRDGSVGLESLFCKHGDLNWKSQY